MGRPVLTETDKEYIRQKRLQMSATKIAKVIGCNKGVVQRWLHNNGLAAPRELQIKFRADARVGRSTFSLEEDAYIGDNYLRYPIKVLAEKMGRSYTGIMGRINALGLEIPDEIRRMNIEAGRIQKGNIPPNKGKKMPASVYRKVKRTMFKKGNIPPNTKERDGVITVRHDHKDRSNSKPYKYIRVGLGKWVPYHRYKWEKHRGKIPRGMLVVFKDGNTLNCNLSNLEIITKEENMRRNSYHNWPEQLAKMVQLRGALNRQINKHSKKFVK